MKLTLCRAIMILIVLECINAIALVYAYEHGVTDSKKWDCVKINHDSYCKEIKS